jgi:hypothetical protein
MKANTMKKYIIFLLILLGSPLVTGCKKFLDVQSITALSGNEYWQSQSDVEAFANNIYLQLWTKLSNSPFISSTGDLRSGEVRSTYPTAYNTGSAARGVYDYMAINDMKNVIDPTKAWSGLNLPPITKWQEFYQVIQSANIMYSKVSLGIPGVSSSDINKYKAEAIFLRCFTYFYMVRIYGDVAYYTKAYQADPLPRENMVSVLNKCIAELKPVKNDLPLKYDGSNAGFRASSGAAIDLLMNMNMWNAGFDGPNKAQYYQETAALAKEIVASNIYHLLPLSSFPQVMEGGTDEGLFALKQGVDFATPNKFGFPGEIFVAYPEKGNTAANGSYSNAYYRSDYLLKIYNDVNDQRPSTWFRNMYINDGRFSMKKFAGTISASGFPDWGIVIFRYADALLLGAEASTELGQDNDAVTLLNMVRTRAGANLYDVNVDSNLKDAVFIERSRELIGEGYHYFDLVRTRRITDASWTNAPLTAAQFNSGAWTWPIDASALSRNPFMTLNSYWQ